MHCILGTPVSRLCALPQGAAQRAKTDRAEARAVVEGHKQRLQQLRKEKADARAAPPTIAATVGVNLNL